MYTFYTTMKALLRVPWLEVRYRIALLPRNTLHRIPMLNDARPLKPKLVHHRTIGSIQSHLVVQDSVPLTREPLEIAQSKGGIGERREEEGECVLTPRAGEGIVVDVLAE